MIKLIKLSIRDKKLSRIIIIDTSIFKIISIANYDNEVATR